MRDDFFKGDQEGVIRSQPPLTFRNFMSLGWSAFNMNQEWKLTKAHPGITNNAVSLEEGELIWVALDRYPSTPALAALLWCASILVGLLQYYVAAPFIGICYLFTPREVFLRMMAPYRMRRHLVTHNAQFWVPSYCD